MMGLPPRPRLRYRSDIRSLLFLGTTLGLLGASWTRALQHPMWAAFSVFPCFICCVIAHNHMHVPTLRGRFWNSCFQLLLMFGSGQPPTGIITAHNERHHGHPDSDQDFVRTSLVGSRWNALNILIFPFRSVSAMIREKPGDLARWKKSRPLLHRQALLERTVFHSILLFLLFVDWKSTLLHLVLPWLAAQLCLVGVNLLQHQDCDMDSEYDHSRNLTGPLANWFLLNNGFHTAHHLRPGMHWSRLPEFHRTHIAPRINPELDHRTFIGLLVERLRRPPASHAR